MLGKEIVISFHYPLPDISAICFYKAFLVKFGLFFLVYIHRNFQKDGFFSLCSNLLQGSTGPYFGSMVDYVLTSI